MAGFESGSWSANLCPLPQSRRSIRLVKASIVIVADEHQDVLHQRSTYSAWYISAQAFKCPTILTRDSRVALTRYYLSVRL